MPKTLLSVTCIALLAIALLAALRATAADRPADKKDRLFELRTYTAVDGKLDAVLARFRDHTNALFIKHGMTPVAYWTPTEGDLAKNTLVYVLAYPDKAARDKAWADFQADPDWIKAKADSEKDGKIVDKVVSVFIKPADFSPLK